MDLFQNIYEYHDRTKHHPGRYAASLGYMDWANQPDPFRTFEGAQSVMLPLPGIRPEPSYGDLFHPVPATPLTRESLSVLLRYSLGLAAVKCMGSECWALRCNASSGNLHPTEGYVVLPPVKGISVHSVVAHYAPKTHALEILCRFDTDFWERLPEGSLLFGITSIAWREAWKYGERAFRYTQLDAGHAIRAVQVAAHLVGRSARLFDAAPPETVDTLLGLDRPERFRADETEFADTLMLISSDMQTPLPDLAGLLAACEGPFAGTANLLSQAQHDWEAVTLIEQATHATPAALPVIPEQLFESGIPESAEAVILRRRSARAMDFGRTRIGMDAFMQIVGSSRIAFEPFEHACSFALFVHDVETLEPGLYLYLLNKKYFETFRRKMRGDFLFRPAAENLYLLEPGDFRAQAKFISCTQDIAADGAFSLGMLCEFAPQIARHGPQRYKSLYWECGAVGQQLYLEATSLGLSATGIGCFLDDVMHRTLGLEGHDFQILYHFTVGRAVPDLRLQTRAPYAGR